MAENEYIEREAMINTCKKIIQERWNETAAPVSWSHAYADFIDDINNQPAADVAPVKRGEWQDCHEIFRCSMCGYSFEHEGYKHFFHFCPNCGACMDGGDKNEK